MLGVGPNVVAPALMFALSRLLKIPGDWKRELVWAEFMPSEIHGKGFLLYKYFGKQ